MISLVKQCKKKYINNEYIFSFFILFVLFSIILNPAKYTQAAICGLEVWAKVLVPALFPFFVLTKLFSYSGITSDISNLFAPVTKKLFNCPPTSSYIFFMSIITGYPVGAKMVSESYNNGHLNKEDSIRTLSFCCNSGPMFIFGSVAIGMFNSFKLGIIIYLSHILGSIFNGMFYRNYHCKKEEKQQKNKVLTNLSDNINFSESISSSINSILLIGGVVCFTFVIIELITTNKAFELIISAISKLGLNKNIITAFFSGILEITKGSLMFSSLPLSIALTAPLCTFIISFGGVSTILQAITFTKNIVPIKLFVLQKLTHAIFATTTCLMLIVLLPFFSF